MKQHAANVDKDFDRTLLIDNPTFNQSATFEFENRLIELFCADDKYQVTNGNNGYAQFDYFERPQYRQKFRTLWTKLREENYAIHPIEELENTDLFEFSRSKTLTPDQYKTIETIYKRLKQEQKDVEQGGPKKKRVTVVNGAPGTGKTILAISLMFKIKNEPNLPGLKPGDILSPSDVTKNDRYDILLVDEAHRLGNCLTAGAGIGAFYNICDRLGFPHTSNQVDWIFKCCDKAYLFYDPKQQVRASGLNRDGLEQRLNQLEEKDIETEEFSLSAQMRVRGGNEYLAFVYDLLDNKAYMHVVMKFSGLFSSEPYDSRAGDPNSDIPRCQFGIVDQLKDFYSL